jgi:hypothetical protein
MLAVCLTKAGRARAQTFVTVGTGAATGVYFPAGVALCRVVNAGRRRHGIHCTAEVTDGSVANVQALRAGDLTLSVVQADVAYHAAKGSGPFADAEPFRDLRTVVALHAEAFTLIARRGSAIKGLGDLRGRRVDIGGAGSGGAITARAVVAAMGWSSADLDLRTSSGMAAQTAALCRSEVDAVVFIVGHPNGAVRQATEGCGGTVLPVTGSQIDTLVAQTPYFRYLRIPTGLYQPATEEVRTFGVGATVLATARLKDDVVRDILGSLFDDLTAFRAMHPALNALEDKEMATTAAPPPLHDGARRFYRERGLLP